jgi:hypothetical protein
LERLFQRGHKVILLVNAIGIAGVFTMLVAYYLLQQGRVTAHQPIYLWMNLLGGLAVILSLFWEWNLPAFLMETAWVLISVLSLMRQRRQPL